MKGLKRIYKILILSVVLLSSCDSRRIFEQFEAVDASVWSQEDLKSFDVQIDDHLQDYNLIFLLRNSGTYPFQNLFVFVSRQAPDGSLNRDTLNIPLANPQGRWNGKGLGDIKELEVMYRYKFRFPESGSFHFEFEQGMRKEKLEGIHDVGLRVERSGK